MKRQKIPVSLEILADMETPLSVYNKLANEPFSYLFESVEGGEKWARYSLIGLPCSKVIKVYNKQIQIFKNGKIEEEIIVSDPLDSTVPTNIIFPFRVWVIISDIPSLSRSL